MIESLGRLAALGAVLTALSACADKEPKLLNFRNSGNGPDEFAILPTKPLQAPEDFTQLPAPTPGGRNLTDPTPNSDAVAALGGRPDRINAGGVPRGDGGIVTYASRFGVAPNIRQTLASEDLEWRRKNDGRLLERLFSVNVYYDAYQPMELDQHAELERWRRAGARTPSAPPPKEGE